MIEIPEILDIPEKLIAVLTNINKYNYFLIEGGRGGGKSQSVARIILYLAEKRKVRVCCGRETQSTISDSVHKIFNDLVSEYNLNFTFNIFKGYTWNGADIPRFLWRLVGSRTDNDFLVASMLHDYMLEFKTFIMKEILFEKISKKEYRRLTSLVFRELVKKQGTNVIKANVMSWCVDVFQMFNVRSWKCP